MKQIQKAVLFSLLIALTSSTQAMECCVNGLLAACMCCLGITEKKLSELTVNGQDAENALQQSINEALNRNQILDTRPADEKKNEEQLFEEYVNNGN